MFFAGRIETTAKQKVLFQNYGGVEVGLDTTAEACWLAKTVVFHRLLDQRRMGKTKPQSDYTLRSRFLEHKFQL